MSVNMSFCFQIRCYQLQILFLLLSIYPSPRIVFATTFDEQDGFKGECFTVQICDQSFDLSSLSLETSSYEIPTQDWNNNERKICPRSDPDIPNWELHFLDSNQPSELPKLKGSYCSIGVQFDPSTVCITTDGTTLVFRNLTMYHNTVERLNIVFNATDISFIANIPMKIAPMGVTTFTNVESLSSPDQTLELVWYVYGDMTDYQVIFEENEIASSSQPTNLQRDTTICFPTDTQERALVYKLTVEPTLASVGEYTFIANSQYSAIVTVVLDSSFVVVPVSPTPSPSVLFTESSSVLSFSSSSSTLVSSATTPDASSSNDLSSDQLEHTLSIAIPVVAGGLVILTVVAVGVFGVCYLKKKRRPSESHEKSQEQKESYQRKKISVVGPPTMPHDQTPDPTPNNHVNGNGAMATIPEQAEQTDAASTSSVDEAKPKTSDTPVVNMENFKSMIQEGIQEGMKQISETFEAKTDSQTQLLVGKLNVMEVKRDEQFQEMSEKQSEMIERMETTFTVEADPQQEPEINKQSQHAHRGEPSSVTKTGLSTQPSTPSLSDNVQNSLDNEPEQLIESSPIAEQYNIPGADDDDELVERSPFPTNNKPDSPTTNSPATIQGQKVAATQSSLAFTTLGPQVAIAQVQQVTPGPQVAVTTPQVPQVATCQVQQVNATTPQAQQSASDTQSSLARESSDSLQEPVFDQKPDSQQFEILVGSEIVEDWQRFGVLIGLSYIDIRIIEQQITNPFFRLTAVLHKWEQTYSEKTAFTWRNVILKLYEMKYNTVANNLKKTLREQSGHYMM